MITKSGYQHIRSFKGHRDVITCFVYNDEFLFTASNDGRILQWSLTDTKNSKPTKQFGRLLDAYWTENERRDGNFSEYTEEEVKEIFKTPSGVKFPENFSEPGNSEYRQINPKSDTFKKLFPWKFSKASEEEKKEHHTQGICCLVMNGRYLYSGSFDTTIIKWDTQAVTPEKTCVATFKGHTQAVYAVRFLDVWLLSASRDKTVRVWNEATGKPTAILGGANQVSRPFFPFPPPADHRYPTHPSSSSNLPSPISETRVALDPGAHGADPRN